MVELTLFIRLSRDHLTAFSIEIVAVSSITTPWPSPIGLYKTEVINRRGPWHTLEVVELATLEWVDWFNHRRLLNPIGYVPPVELQRSAQGGDKGAARATPSRWRRLLGALLYTLLVVGAVLVIAVVSDWTWLSGPVEVSRRASEFYASGCYINKFYTVFREPNRSSREYITVGHPPPKIQVAPPAHDIDQLIDRSRQRVTDGPSWRYDSRNSDRIRQIRKIESVGQYCRPRLNIRAAIDVLGGGGAAILPFNVKRYRHGSAVSQDLPSANGIKTEKGPLASLGDRVRELSFFQGGFGRIQPLSRQVNLLPGVKGVETSNEYQESTEYRYNSVRPALMVAAGSLIVLVGAYFVLFVAIRNRDILWWQVVTGLFLIGL